MAKIGDRKKLSRGIKLTPDHIFETMRDVKSEVESVNIQASQLEKAFAPFCVNLSIPSINVNAQPPGTACIPFILPPLQDFFKTESMGTDSFGFPLKKPSYERSLPKLLFTGISFSFDQRNEPAAIASNYWRDGYPGSDPVGPYGFSKQQGMLCYDLVRRLDIKLSLLKKEMLFFSELGVAESQSHEATNIVWSCMLPSFFFSNTVERANPFIQTDIDIAIDPYCSYVLKIECPGLCDNDPVASPSLLQYIKHLVLPSVEVSLKFKHELVEKDTGASNPNIPTNASTGTGKYGVPTHSSVSIQQPSAGNAITADADNTGVSTNLGRIDDVFSNKIAGGWTQDADLPITEQLRVPAGYDVIALPLFNNAAFGGIGASNETFNTQAYVADSPGIPPSGASLGGPAYAYARAIFDRRVMPIHYSYTIHHAVLAWNWTPFRPFNVEHGGDFPPPTSTVHPTCLVPPANAKFRLEVGIGLGTALKSDSIGYNQISHLVLNDPHGFTQQDSSRVRGWGEGASLIDRINASDVTSRRYKHGDSDPNAYLGQVGWNWELHSMALDWRSQHNTPNMTGGFFRQDYPIFVGPGRTNAHTRENAPSPHDQYVGSDQFIEVRGAFYLNHVDEPYDGHMPLMPPVTSATGLGVPLQDDHTDGRYLFVGYGGCWVYLICKKHLTG